MRELCWYIFDEDNRSVVKVPMDNPNSGQMIESFLKSGRKRVGYDEVEAPWGQVFDVSTVLLCIDHRWDGDGDPIIFETMVFPHETFSDMYCRRYSTYEDAEAGHRAAMFGIQEGTLELDDYYGLLTKTVDTDNKES